MTSLTSIRKAKFTEARKCDCIGCTSNAVQVYDLRYYCFQHKVLTDEERNRRKKLGINTHKRRDF